MNPKIMKLRVRQWLMRRVWITSSSAAPRSSFGSSAVITITATASRWMMESLASLELLKDLQEANELPLGAGEQITGAVAVPTDDTDTMLRSWNRPPRCLTPR